MRQSLAALLLGALLLAAPSAADAQTTTPTVGAFGVGPRLSITDDGDFAIGAEARIRLLTLAETIGLVIRPTFDYFIVDDVTLLDFSADALFTIDVGNAMIQPYGIAGLGIYYFSFDFLGESESEIDLGLNLGAGITFLPTRRIQPFAELRATIKDGTLILFTAGVIFVL